MQSESGQTPIVPKWVGIDPKTHNQRWDDDMKVKAKLGQGHAVPSWAKNKENKINKRKILREIKKGGRGWEW